MMNKSSHAKQKMQERDDVLPLHDPERLGALLEELKPRLTAVALKYTRNHSAADDVVQNAFEKVIRNGHQFQGNSKVSTWIHRIVANEALMWLRSQNRRILVSMPEEDHTLTLEYKAPNAYQEFENRELGKRLRSGLKQLRSEDRMLLENCVLQGRSYREYSEELGIHPSALKTRVFRARQNLSAYIQQST